MSELWIVVACFASAIGGAWVGYRACDSYWTERIEKRPESIHLGPYIGPLSVLDKMEPHTPGRKDQCYRVEEKP